MMSKKTARMHDIVCSRCGAHDMVPFRPRPGTDVMCRTCFEKGHDRRDDRRSDRHADRQGPPRGRAERPRTPVPMSGPRTWSIHCSSCGATDEVPFEPRPNSEVLCRACHDARKEERAKAPAPRTLNQDRDRANPTHLPSIPRLEHGTRVYYPIVCQKCGKHEVLSYVPRVNGELMCTECAAERYGRTWYQVKLAAEAEHAEHTIECATCGREDTIPFKPHADRKYHCRRCLEEQVQPNKRRLDGFEEVDGGLRVRKQP